MDSAAEGSVGSTPDKCTDWVLLPWSWRSVLVPGAAALLSLALIPYGVAIFRVLQPALENAPLQHLFALALQYANPFAPVVVLLTVWMLDRRRRHFLPYLVVGALAAGGLNSVIKETAGRRRPEWSINLDAHREKVMLERAQRHPDKYIPIEHRDLWLGLHRNRLWFADWDASFPSGHACAAFALAAFLCAMYPEARWIWLGLAVLAALARVKSSHHYLEDILMGGAIGWTVSLWAFSWRWPGRVGRFLTGSRSPAESHVDTRQADNVITETMVSFRNP
ncbi:MAG: phosphatase PAP2 family protein [Candidatus Hydrogenedentota bacterium]|jgi:membrane-associated phospholipid phosphatase|uniref:Phosphatidic acid phosphatase type 2/haloperoxidase domain-containing protein n=1 Tax=Sumerlaea chitinivorans TaxID=2250252 RepID=A0A2Z4Y5C3_SUMC1|nr:hypothetical protein BRCON_1135 [Candidatus Sumerlaea chitinivorans]MCX7963209.1 phosphatase PAP2 family protein [Candidatus Sumerlaea chitinivorans]RMH25980.1 MAG: phosphatase PAP2 family protein [Candidatus Hydrogenedentota bacterium]GIX44129.1 MAG: hypothetical protein KatS3mg130_0537 [Candidatus Sumerlaea sp.]